LQGGSPSRTPSALSSQFPLGRTLLAEEIGVELGDLLEEILEALVVADPSPHCWELPLGHEGAAGLARGERRDEVVIPDYSR
jgi:hypothetical protein